MHAHWAASLFPRLSAEELEELADDIEKNGQLDPIVLLDGEILDGRNRFAACQAFGIDPRFVDADESARRDPVAWVISKNLRRRHLDESQRAMVAARLREEMGKRDAGPSANLRTADAAAASLNVSTRSVESASVVLRTAEPELVEAVDAGKVAVSAAAEIANLPPEEQREAAADPKKAKKKAKAAREKKKAKKSESARRDARVVPMFAAPADARKWDEPAALRVVSDFLRDVVAGWGGSDRASLIDLLRGRAEDLEVEDANKRRDGFDSTGHRIPAVDVQSKSDVESRARRANRQRVRR